MCRENVSSLLRVAGVTSVIFLVGEPILPAHQEGTRTYQEMRVDGALCSDTVFIVSGGLPPHPVLYPTLSSRYPAG